MDKFSCGLQIQVCRGRIVVLTWCLGASTILGMVPRRMIGSVTADPAPGTDMRRLRPGLLATIGRTWMGSLLAAGFLIFGCASAVAEPEPPAPVADSPAAEVRLEGAAAPASAACQRFDAVLRVSSAYYNDFAYTIAGNGAYVDYRDPEVRDDNVVGRTALRQAAGEAWSAAGASGVPSEIADPMRAWSWRAVKLALAMGLHGDGDTLNTAAAELNTHAENAKMACTKAGA